MKTKHRHKTRSQGLLLAVVLTVALLSANLIAATHYVWQNSPNPEPPYDSWATAAHVIQDAVDAAVDGDTVLVTNGVYGLGEWPMATAVNPPFSL